MNGVYRVALLLAGLALLSWMSLRIPIPGTMSATRASEEKLVIITPHWDGIRNEFRTAFSHFYREKTGKSISIEWLDPGGTSDCIRYIKSEFGRIDKQGNPGVGIGVDLFFGGGTDPYFDLKKQGLLLPVALDSAILDQIPLHVNGIPIYDSSGYWYGAVLSGFGIVYNKVVAKWMNFKLPREWRDLADPRYYSWIGAADPRNSGTMHLMFEIILQAYGWDEGWRILTGIAANARTFSKGANDVPKMVAKGDMAFGLAIDFYAWAEVSAAGEEKVGFILPENLTVVTADAIGMLRGAPNSDAARMFIEFVLSEQGQKIWFLRKGVPGGPGDQELNRMSIRPDMYIRYMDQTNIRQNPFDMSEVRSAVVSGNGRFHFDQSLASRRWALVNDLIGAALIDQGDALRKAWNLYSGHDEKTTWALMPLNEGAALILADSVWSDPVRKNTMLLDWHRFYKRKYSKLAGD